MEQKLLQPMKGVLPQDNLTNLAIAAVLTIIIVYAAFQLLNHQQDSPILLSSTVNEMDNRGLANLYKRIDVFTFL
ncbi:MAG: hypothetical protein PV340_00705 [Wolbachia sp.]|nr:hypothetical protein [Wolbachia sp.]MDD9335903.1 hypothetical protein [Wolbachia sp.]